MKFNSNFLYFAFLLVVEILLLVLHVVEFQESISNGLWKIIKGMYV